MSKSEKFSFFATIVGFIVDISALLGFALGFVRLSPSLGFLANPFVVATLTYTFSFFFIGALLYFIIQRAKIGWKRHKKTPKINSYSGGYEGLNQLGTLLWVPTGFLWTIGMMRYFWFYFYGSQSFGQVIQNDGGSLQIPGTLLFLTLFPLFFAGFQLPSMAKSLDDFFDPKY